MQLQNQLLRIFYLLFHSPAPYPKHAALRTEDWALLREGLCLTPRLREGQDSWLGRHITKHWCNPCQQLKGAIPVNPAVSRKLSYRCRFPAPTIEKVRSRVYDGAHNYYSIGVFWQPPGPMNAGMQYICSESKHTVLLSLSGHYDPSRSLRLGNSVAIMLS